MHGFTAIALLGVSAFASARPLQARSAQPNQSVSATGSVPSSTGSSGPYTNATSGKPFRFPLANGFPSVQDPSPIEQQALGTLPNGTPPPSLHADSETSLGLIAFNELFEVAFFTELIQNITTNVKGYGPGDVPDRDEVLKVLQVVVAQEELHELNANGAFKKFTGQTILPCEYQFPVNNFMDAIALASTFTDVVLSTLPDIQTIFAENNDDGLIRGVGSVIGQEGEQNGFYRHLLGKSPSALPFLTGGARDFAFNGILQNFVVPGSCPSLELLKSRGLKEFGVLDVLTKTFSLEDVEAEFAFQTGSTAQGHSFIQQTGSHSGGLYLTYINQQNVPISVPIKNQQPDEETGAIKFTAQFPGKTNDLNGLTIAAITSTNGPFTSPDEVADATLFGPGLIEV